MRGKIFLSVRSGKAGATPATATLPLPWAADAVADAITLITDLHQLVESGTDLRDALARINGTSAAARAAKCCAGQRLAGLPGEAPGISRATRAGRPKRVIYATCQVNSVAGKWPKPAIFSCPRLRATVCIKSRPGLAWVRDATATTKGQFTPPTHP